MSEATLTHDSQQAPTTEDALTQILKEGAQNLLIGAVEVRRPRVDDRRVQETRPRAVRQVRRR